MEIKIGKSSAPRPRVSKVESSKKGTVTLLEETRLSGDQTKESVNLLQVQDGIWRTRWGREYYGNAIEAETNLDAAFEYIKDRGKSSESRHIVVCGASGIFYKSTDDGKAWAVIPGATFTGGVPVSGLQIAEYFYFVNGYDSMTRYDGSTLTQYSAIDVPENLALTRNVLTTGSYNAYYQVTALNEVGETAGCTEVSVSVNKERDLWVTGESIDLNWDAVAGAIRYQIYYSDDSGYESLLGSSQVNSFTDDGSLEPNPYIVTPVDDTTVAPKFRHIELSGNRIWGTGDPENPYRVYFSGVGQFISYFSAYYGGGWVDLEYGGREISVGVVNYRSGGGSEISTVFTKTPEGTGSIWQIDLDVATSDTLTFTLPVPEKIVDYIGCTSHGAIVKAGDKVFFPNINGIFDLGNKEQMYNILVSAEVSQSIRPDYRNFNEDAIGGMIGHYYDAKLFFSASVGGGENDVVYIYDVERKNWNYYWDFGVKHFFEATDLGIRHHFLAVPTSGNRLVEINDKFTRDFGGAFRTSYVSGLFSFEKRMDGFAKVYQGIVEFGDLKGAVNFEIFGIEKNRGFRAEASREYIEEADSATDFANALWSDFMWSEGTALPISYTEATIKKRLRVNKRLNRIQFKISSSKAGTEYSILGLQANGRGIAMNPPNVWRD